MAIAFNAATDGNYNSGGGNTHTFSHTVGAGTNRLIVVLALATNADLTGATYGGTSMTLATSKTTGLHINNTAAYLYYLLNPTSGANNVVITGGSTGNIFGAAADYTGVKQTAQPDATAVQIGSGSITTLTTSVTTVADNSWAVLIENSYNGGPAPAAGSGSTSRVTNSAFGGFGIFDSGGVIHPAGSYSMTTTRTSAVDSVLHIIASFQPDTGGGGFVGAPYYYMNGGR